MIKFDKLDKQFWASVSYKSKEIALKNQTLHSLLRIWSYLQKKSLMKTSFFVQWKINQSVTLFNCNAKKFYG